METHTLDALVKILTVIYYLLSIPIAVCSILAYRNTLQLKARNLAKDGRNIIKDAREFVSKL